MIPRKCLMRCCAKMILNTLNHVYLDFLLMKVRNGQISCQSFSIICPRLSCSLDNGRSSLEILILNLNKSILDDVAALLITP